MMEIEFTPEQQKHIDSLIAEKTNGLYSRDDLDREVTREVDRRVESGIQKGIETQKSKWQEEFEKKSQLTAEELAEQKLQEKMKEIQARELELSLKGNTLEAKSMLANAEIPKEHYERFVGILVDGDEEKTKLNVQNFVDTFNETRVEIEKSLKEKYSQVPSPKSGGSSGGKIGKTEFNKMTYAEKMKVKSDNPDLYKQLIG